MSHRLRYPRATPLAIATVLVAATIALTPAPAHTSTSTAATSAGAQSTSIEALRTSPQVALLAGDVITSAEAPTISGTPEIGATLTVVTSGWSPAPVDLSYQWKRNGTSIAGATAAAYLLAEADVAQAITVTVTGAKSGYSDLALTSVAVTAARTLTATPTPTIAGQAQVGSVLTALPGTWGPAPVTLSYQWKRDGAPIAGATSATYAVVLADAAAAITVTVTGVKSTYASVSTTSDETAVVIGGAITSAPTPTIAGSPRVGAPLTAVTGTWAPAPITLHYRWKWNGTPIAGATASTFTPQAAHAGGTLTVTVTGSRPGYAPIEKTSAASATVTGGVLTPASAPRITGTNTVGSTLTATVAGWGPSPVALKYTWKRDGIAIAGAVAPTYLLVNDDAGSSITVTVTGGKIGFTEVERSSATTSMITGGIFAAPLPTVAGTPLIGSTLTATAGAWTPAPTTVTYQWSRSGAPIAGATSANYTLTVADIDAAITVTVAGTRAGFTPVTKTSTALTPLRTFAATPTPVITGTVGVGSMLAASTGAWSPSPVFSYQWTRNGVGIPGATSATYVLVTADAGQPIRVVVTGSAAGYLSATTTSAAVTVPLAFVVASAPTISGTMTTGAVLTASTGSVSPAPASVTYQWYRNGSPIAGATSSTYTVLPTDVDAVLTVSVTVTRPGYTTVTTTSVGRTAVGVVYPNCAALNLVYPHGVAKIGITADMVAGVPKALGSLTFFSTSLYNLNPARDADGDGVACEKH